MMQKIILLEKSITNIVGMINPLPKNCLNNTKLYSLKYLQPVLSIEGNVINSKFKDLKFHFITCPVNFSYVDYRLLEDNTYEVLGTNSHCVSDYDTYDAFLNALHYSQDGHFDYRKESQSVAIKEVNTNDHNTYKLLTEKCSWCQGTYRLSEDDIKDKLSHYINKFIQQNIEEEFIQKYLNEDYEIYQKELFEDGYSKQECLSFSINNLKDYLFDEFYIDFKEDADNTNYAHSDLKDEKGNALEFVASIDSQFDIFGSYYLYYSSKTKLVRLFFQCT